MIERYRYIYNNWLMIKYVAKLTPLFFIAAILLGVIWGAIHFITSVFFIKILFDSLERGESFYNIVILTLTMASFYLIVWLYHQWFWHIYEPKARQVLHEKMQGELYKKAIDLDLAYYDNADFYNDFVWAMQEADVRAVTIVEDLSKLLTRVISSCAIIALLTTINFTIVLIMIVSIVSTILLNFLYAKLQFERDVKLNPIKRHNEYISRVFYLSDYAKELRTTRVKNIFFEQFTNNIKTSNNILHKIGIRLFSLKMLIGVISTTLFDIGIIILLLYKYIISKSITLGDLSASINATHTLYWQLNEIMSYISKFKQHSLYADKLFKFLSYQSSIVNIKPTVNLPSENTGISITLKNVSFKYDINKQPILNNISFSIEKGEKVAIVGYNGAGKSTLIKLLLRLYDPYSGNIYMNDINIKNFEVNEYRKNIGVVFQDFKIFATSIAKNVSMNEQYNKSAVEDALQTIGFKEKLDTLKAGLNTSLTREFDSSGVNLSGGEQQKIALSRIFSKKYNFLILDEPSSSLDPTTEYELNKIIVNELKGKSIIFISHRLATTKMMDKIIMMENGGIIEVGNHEELMKLDGKYAEMFNIQAEKYRINKVENK